MAKYVFIKGWKQGATLGVITLVHFLQRQCGLSLPEAKRLGDQFAEDGGLALLIEDTLPVWVGKLSEANIEYEINSESAPKGTTS